MVSIELYLPSKGMALKVQVVPHNIHGRASGLYKRTHKQSNNKWQNNLTCAFTPSDRVA